MRSLLHESRGFLVLLIVPLVGCTLGASKPAAVPPAPKPAAVQPPPPEPPLSIPQTAVTLPSPQPLNPDALPDVPAAAQDPPAVEKAEIPPAPRVPRRSAAGPPKPDATEAETDSPPTPPPAAVQEQAPAIQPILRDDERIRIKNAIESRKKEINEKLGRAKGHPSAHDQRLIDLIQSFVEQSEQAEKRGDYSQANSLSERALVLAQGLLSE